MLLVAVLVTVAICYLTWDRTKVPRTIKGPRCYPLLGTLPDIYYHFGSLNYLNRYIASLYKRYGWTIRVRFLHQERVIICHPADITAIYTSDGKYPRNVTASFPSVNYVDKMSGIDHMTLASTEGERWKFLRHELARHIFLPRKVSSYLSYINPVTRDLSAIITRQQANGQLVNLEVIMPFFACEVIGNVMLGKRLGTLSCYLANDTVNNSDNESSRFARGVVDFFHQSYCFNFEIPWWRLFMTPKFKRYLTMYQSMRKYIRGQVAKMIDEIKLEDNLNAISSEDNLNTSSSKDGLRGNRDNSSGDNISDGNSTDTGPYIKRMLANSKLTTDELSEGIITLFIGGVDATATATNVLLLYLAQNHRVQDRLHDELKAVLDGDDYDEARAPQLTYLKCVFKELYRIAPPVPGTVRILNQDVTLQSGEVLPADTNVILCSEGLLNDSRFIDEPQKFMPERWFDEARQARKDRDLDFVDKCINYLPFSFGPRMCIGAGLATVEMYSVIARLIQDFQVSLAPNQPKYEFISAPFTQASPSPRLVFSARV